MTTLILNFLLKQWKYILLITLAGLCFTFFKMYSAEKVEKNRQKSNVEVLNSNYTSYKVAYNTGLKTINKKDSIIYLNAGKNRALIYTVKEYEKYSKEDKQIIKDLGLKIKNIQSTSGVITQTITNTVIQLKDSCFNKSTKWQDVSGCIIKDSIKIKTTNRDSLFLAISMVSKYNFLFFHWGSKIDNINAVSKNPDTFILGLDYKIVKH